MNSVRKLIKADNALMRSGPVGILQKIFYALYILLLAYPILVVFDGSDTEVLHFNMFLGAFYCVAMFLYSGYFPMADNPSMKGFAYTFIRSAHFMPFTKADYIKAAFIQWVKIYAVYLVSQISAMIIAMVKSSPISDVMGSMYFQLDVCIIIMGIVIVMPIILGHKISEKNFFWYLSFGIALLCMLGFSLIEYFLYDEANAALGWYCSIWGILGGIAVIPIVGGVTALVFRARKNHTWFRG